MLEQAITELQNIERSVVRKTLSDLQIRLALRSCLKELRSLSVACPTAREQLGYRSPPRFVLVIEIRKRLPVRQRQLTEIAKAHGIHRVEGGPGLAHKTAGHRHDEFLASVMLANDGFRASSVFLLKAGITSAL
jgi:hypothetical protein